MAMSLQDFSACTPSEFRAIYDVWNKHQYNLYRDRWERTRAQCYLLAQVNSSKIINPEEIMPFPWDEQQKPKQEEMSKEEREARYQAALKRYGITTEETKKDGR